MKSAALALVVLGFGASYALPTDPSLDILGVREASAEDADRAVGGAPCTDIYSDMKCALFGDTEGCPKDMHCWRPDLTGLDPRPRNVNNKKFCLVDINPPENCTIIWLMGVICTDG